MNLCIIVDNKDDVAKFKDFSASSSTPAPAKEETPKVAAP